MIDDPSVPRPDATRGTPAAPAAPVAPVVPDPPAVPDPSVAPSLPPGPGGAPPAVAPAAAGSIARYGGVALALFGALCLVSLVLALRTEQRSAQLEQALVLRQQESTGTATEARQLAKQTQEAVVDAAARIALIDARVAEVSVQRGQLEELIQSLSRSRDENLLVDVEAGIRVALQQSAVTGSTEPLVATLKQSEERLARYSQPRLEGVRRAIGRDLDRIRSVSVADMASLGAKIDEVIRLVDDLPLLATPYPRQPMGPAAAAPARPLAAAPATAAASAPSTALTAPTEWLEDLERAWHAVVARIWDEVRSLVRVTRIEHSEAMLLAPEQSFYLRENLKLRLLNARLALLSRQFDTAQADLQAVQAAIERFVEPNARRTLSAVELLRQVAAQARQVVVPRPDDTLAALTAASIGR